MTLASEDVRVASDDFIVMKSLVLMPEQNKSHVVDVGQNNRHIVVVQT